MTVTAASIVTAGGADGRADGSERPDAVVALRNVTKTYGSTVANDSVTLAIGRGEVIGLVGANGAGKSTAMRILCGATMPDSGSVLFEGRELDPGRYGPAEAHRLGIRIVYQELSLCPNLTVAENFYLEQPQHARPSPLWLAEYRRLARESLSSIFGDTGIDVAARVGSLPISQRQMIEIARAASSPGLKLLILDEPTSSLDAGRAAALHRFVRLQAAAGLSVIFISHKLKEVLEVADRVVVMRNGRVVWEDHAERTSVPALVEAMGGTRTAEAAGARARPPVPADAPVMVTLDGDLTSVLGRPVELRAGEIVGLAGLEGSGQKQLLHALFKASAGAGDVQRTGRVSFVSGDRQREGVFPLWSVLDNIAIGRTARRMPTAMVDRNADRDAAARWSGPLALDPERFESGILDLSGGNQQKALMARALISGADVVLLDDPTRGVDIGAKRDFYGLLREIAAERKLAVWYSTEDAEFLECDRVLVFRDGRIVAELEGDAISEDAIVAASFTAGEAGAGPERARSPGQASAAGRIFAAVPFVGLLIVFGIMAAMNPLVASAFGIELLLAPAVVLVLVALAQMFVIGGSEIDLGVGAFAGLVNVISATLLVSHPGFGALALAGGLLGYALMAVLIQARAIPAIVMTLGASFIWAGIGQTIQPSPGGSSPEWLPALFQWSVAGVPTPLLLILAAGALAVAIDRAPVGVVLRGFGSNPQALARNGWSPLRYAVVRYLIAGAFAATAGLYLTATNQASDINAGASFTLLSIAAVVIGGSQLLGGVIAPAGVVAGAVTLSLIGALLAFLGVGTDYNALVQGGLLVAILGLRTVVGWRRTDDRPA